MNRRYLCSAALAATCALAILIPEGKAQSPHRSGKGRGA